MALDPYEAADKEEKMAFEEAVERKRMFMELKEHPFYQFFVEALETQLKARYSRLVGFPSNLDKIVQNNYTCGEVAGIKLALEFADTVIENAQEVIDFEKSMQDREKEAVEDSNYDSNPKGL